MKKKSFGAWPFILGVAIAVLGAFVTAVSEIVFLIALFALGLIVGFINVSEKDYIKFLVGAVSLVLLGIGSISILSVLGSVSNYLNSILGNFIVFVASAALVVSIKVIYETSR